MIPKSKENHNLHFYAVAELSINKLLFANQHGAQGSVAGLLKPTGVLFML